MRKIAVVYHEEEEGWWAESDDMPGFSAAGDTLEEVREQVHSGVPYFCGEEVSIEEGQAIINGEDNEVRIELDSVLLLHLINMSPNPMKMIESNKAHKAISKTAYPYFQPELACY